MTGFDELLQHYQGVVNEQLARLNSHLLTVGAQPQVIAQTPALGTYHRATEYVLQNGGKRVRPLLAYFAAEAVDPAIDQTLLHHPACAVEWLHTYSLVHDDLPAMDDDDLRRGKPSCHRAFNEATAILVGDGLQAQAFELLGTAPGLNAQQKLDMIICLTQAAGPGGMVGGQQIDITAVDTNMTLAQLQTMHRLKTGALIRAALSLGGITAGASKTELVALESYGDHIGLAFQVVDDILDVESNTEALGKTQGKDEAANKPTYVALLGLEGAKKHADDSLQQALTALEHFDSAADKLRHLARYIVARDH